MDVNTEKRINAADRFEKYFLKSMINSAYDKTMENLQKTTNVMLIKNQKNFLKYTSKPTHISHKIFGKNYAAIHELEPVLAYSKLVYVRLVDV